VLQTKRRLEPAGSGVEGRDLEQMLGRPREHLEFTIWYLVQKGLVQRDDSARLLITAEGIDFLEENYRTSSQRRRLPASAPTS
jgi:hypothetical protein